MNKNLFFKIEQFIFYILFFSIPLQVRFIFSQWTYPFNEWTSGFIYFTDILIFILFILWAIRYKKSEEKINFSISDKLLFSFLVLSFLSVFVAGNMLVSIFRLIKLTEVVGLYFYVLNSKNKIFQFDTLIKVILASGIFQASIGILQSMLQSSLGLRFLWESILHVGNQGIAVFEVGGNLFLRAYGTLPHPNILSAWLLVVIAFWYIYFLNLKEKVSIYMWIGYIITIWGFLATYSRTTIGVWILLSVPLFFIKKNKNIFKLIAVTVLIGVVFSSVYWKQVTARINVSRDEEAVTQRIFYAEVAGKITEKSPLRGIGIGQFVPNIIKTLPHYPSYIYQPAHNVYLLISSEIGIFGLGVFIAFIFIFIFRSISDFRKISKDKIILVFLFVGLLIIGIFDHLFWTQQQGMLMFWILLGLIQYKNSTYGIV